MSWIKKRCKVVHSSKQNLTISILKKYIVLVLLLTCCKAASSQVLIALLFGDELNTGKLEFGLMLSPTITNLTNTESKPKPAIDFGLYFNFEASDRIYLHPEAIPKLSYGAKKIAPYSTGNSSLDSLYANGTVTRKIKAIGLPLLVRYRISGLFFAEAGPQIDLITTGKDVFETKVNDNELFYENKIKDDLTRFDIGYAVGLAYKIKPGLRGMTLGIRYYGGLTDVIKTINESQRNSAWFLNIYIPVGAGKATTKKSADEKP
jgi:hypothetical protein